MTSIFGIVYSSWIISTLSSNTLFSFVSYVTNFAFTSAVIVNEYIVSKNLIKVFYKPIIFLFCSTFHRRIKLVIHSNEVNLVHRVCRLFTVPEIWNMASSIPDQCNKLLLHDRSVTFTIAWAPLGLPTV